jgi:mRNA interferase RelE/StbE
MSYKVMVRPQVMRFASTLGPVERRSLKRVILSLVHEKGDIRPLGEELAGWYRLRVGRHRVIFRYLPGMEIQCVFVEERRIVYEIFESEMNRILGVRSRTI